MLHRVGFFYLRYNWYVLPQIVQAKCGDINTINENNSHGFYQAEQWHHDAAFSCTSTAHYANLDSISKSGILLYITSVLLECFQMSRTNACFTRPNVNNAIGFTFK